MEGKLQQNDESIVEQLFAEAVSLLQKLIETPSFSKEEHNTANIIATYLSHQHIPCYRHLNNVWAINKYFDPIKPSILLNSHHDTVKPNKGYTKDPFKAEIADGKLYGLGSNDAGGALVALLQTFSYFYHHQNLNYNLVFAATAEEEISGVNGIASILDKIGKIDFAIVGEPTEMHLAIAEKGLMVLDCEARGTAAHVALPNADNAIINACKDILWFTNYRFPKKSELLGDVQMTVSLINGGIQHNIVPDSCRFTVDVRTTDCYSNQEILDIIMREVTCEVKPRSLRLNASGISEEHVIVKAGKSLGMHCYGSPTLSDQALMPFASVKIGPGISLRSHSSDEYILLQEIRSSIDLYIQLLKKIL